MIGSLHKETQNIVWKGDLKLFKKEKGVRQEVILFIVVIDGLEPKFLPDRAPFPILQVI